MKSLGRPLCFSFLVFLQSTLTTGFAAGTATTTSPSKSAAITFAPVDVSLVAESSTIQPGVPFTVGFYQEIRPGFHTYWRNPGTVGLATSLEWNLPPGFSAGPIQWSLPQTSQMADYEIWGYRNEALLLVDITPPDPLPAEATSFRLETEAAWMCCGRQCHPGFKTLTLDLAPGPHPDLSPNWNSRFQKVRQQQPRTFAEWTISIEREAAIYRLKIAPQNKPETLEPRTLQFFGFRRQVSSARPQNYYVTQDAYHLTLQHEEFSGEDHERLTGMIVSDRPWNTSFPEAPLLIDAPIHNASQP